MRCFLTKNYSITAIAIAILALFFASIAAIISLINASFLDFIGNLALLEIIFGVLVLAVLTTGKPVMTKIITIIISSGTILAVFTIGISAYTQRDVIFFAIAIIMVISSVLSLIYSLSAKETRLKKFFIAANSVLTASIILYTIAFIIEDTIKSNNYNLSYYFILFSFACLSILPLISFLSVCQKEKEKEAIEAVEGAMEEDKSSNP